jgi:hypothetical protein
METGEALSTLEYYSRLVSKESNKHAGMEFLFTNFRGVH